MGEAMGEGDVATRDPAAEAEALRRLFEEHRASVYRMARSVVRDPGLAEDVTQETFIRAWQHADRYRGDAPIAHWLLRIAHNVAVSTLRSIREEAVDSATLLDRQEGASTRPDQVVESRNSIERALDQLEPLDRALVVLRELEAMSYAEIADFLELPMPTVKTRLFRARGKLRRLGEEDHG